MCYGQLLPHLLRGAIVEPRSLDPPPRPYHPSYDKNARCEYHADSQGHTVENCIALKHKVQDLINDKQLNFEGGIPLVNNHPLL